MIIMKLILLTLIARKIQYFVKNNITSYPTTMLYSECELQNTYKGYITYKEFEEDNE